MLQRCKHYKELWSFRRSRVRSLRLLAASQEESKVMKMRKRAYLLAAEHASEELRCRAAHYCTETTVDETVLRTKTGCHQSASYRTRSRTQTTSSAALHTSLPWSSESFTRSLQAAHLSSHRHLVVFPPRSRLLEP